MYANKSTDTLPGPSGACMSKVWAPSASLVKFQNPLNIFLTSAEYKRGKPRCYIFCSLSFMQYYYCHASLCTYWIKVANVIIIHTQTLIVMTWMWLHVPAALILTNIQWGLGALADSIMQTYQTHATINTTKLLMCWLQYNAHNIEPQKIIVVWWTFWH